MEGHWHDTLSRHQCRHRDNRPQPGPIADDGVVLQLTNFREGIYTPEQAAAQLQDRYLDQQYYFGTEQALRFLHKTNVEVV